MNLKGEGCGLGLESSLEEALWAHGPDLVRDVGRKAQVGACDIQSQPNPTPIGLGHGHGRRG